MNRSCLAAIVAFVVLGPLATFAQEDSRLASSIETLRFPPLARQAGIQGDVRLRSGSDGLTVAYGHPLLAQVAVAHLKEFGKLSEAEGDVIYHFLLVDETEIRATKTTVKKSNRFGRLILRAFMMKTEKVVERYECIEHPTRLKNRIDLTQSPIHYCPTDLRPY